MPHGNRIYSEAGKGATHIKCSTLLRSANLLASPHCLGQLPSAFYYAFAVPFAFDFAYAVSFLCLCPRNLCLFPILEGPPEGAAYCSEIPREDWFVKQREALGAESCLYTFMRIAACEKIQQWGFDETTLDGHEVLNQ